VLALLHFGLREGGTLFLGSSETITGVENLFEPIDKRSHIFRRIGAVRHESVDFAFPALKRDSGEPSEARPALRPTIAQHTQRTLLEKFTPPTVTVDRQYRVVYFHGDTSPYISQPSGEPTRELFSLVRDDFRGAVRSALHQAVTDNRLAVSRDGIVEDEHGRYRLEIAATPMDGKGASGYYVVSFTKTGEVLSPPPEGGVDEQDPSELRSELRRTKEELQSAIEELQSTNEELRASHEEAMSVNEELQSTNEELETSKEELQSLNEELTTVNVQLQTKMEEHEGVVNDLNSLLSSTNIAVIFLDTRLRIRRFTPAAIDLFELLPSDAGRPLSDLDRKFDDETLLKDCQAVLDKLAPVERKVTSHTSACVYVRRVQPYRTIDNRINGVVITFIDVSAIDVAQTAQRESELRFRQVIEGAQDFAMLLMDAQGKIVTWNVGAERLLGWTREEAIGRDAGMIWVGPDADAQQAREMQKAVRDGRAEDETWHRRKDGTKFWGSGVLTTLRGDDGQVDGFVKVLRDETARRDAETDRDHLLHSEQQARQEAEQANLVKDQFLARLSHELRTPLSSILTWAEMLQHRPMTEDQLAEGLRVIERSAGAQRELLDDLLDTSRIASGKLRLAKTVVHPVRLAQTVIETHSLAARERGVALELQAADDVGQLLADPDRLRQVLTNLNTNAIKFTPSGGRVDVNLQRTDHLLEIRVADTGQGIHPDFLPHIFTPFSQADFTATRSYGGLGLGLAISRDLVEMHGGSIRAESFGEGQGSVFIIHLPLPGPQQLAATDVELELMPGGDDYALQGLRILLVEDDPATQSAFLRMLTAGGASVAPASTADEAYALFSQQPPDVIVSDIGLPNEDGYALLRRIRELERQRGMKHIPAIALTAFAGPQHRRNAAAAGFQAHVAKPVKLAALASTIARYTRDR
jgi:two-component system CheB/CheR fusion protein